LPRQVDSQCQKYIEQTIQSVISQKNCDLEHVIDAASTDKTLRIIKQYESQITHWVSEQDKGIADAMNKGVALATGEYLMFLNTDDYFGSPCALAVPFMQDKKDLYI